jgi:hypothetical protein
MRLTQEDINEINKTVGDYWNEGVFREPNYIPVHIKEHVIYMRWVKSGYAGGSCYDTNAEYFERNKPEFTVLDLVLKKVCPNISYLQYREVERLIHTNEETEYEYYGNSDDIEVNYIILSDLYKLLNI